MDEFIDWAKENIALHRRYESLDLRTKNGAFISQDARELYAAWLESARRADKRAREECMEICSELRRDNYAGENEDWIAGADDCAKAIRATIKEDK